MIMHHQHKKAKDLEITNFVKLSKSDLIKYSCCHGGKTYKSRSKGERSNHSTGKIGCPFVLRLKSTKDGQALEVMKFD